MTCKFAGEYERRGLSALLHVDCHARYHLNSYHKYSEHYLLLDPALWLVELPNGPLHLLSPRGQGLCLCALRRICRHNLLRKAREVRLTLPSSDELYQCSPSSVLKALLRENGAPELVYLDYRTDWAYAFDADNTKSILYSPKIRVMRSLNPLFVVISPHLSKLSMGAEEDAFTWLPADIYSILRECPQLEELELLTVLAPAPRGWDYRREMPIALENLVRLRMRDCYSQWLALKQLLDAPSLIHIEVDIISSHMGMDRTDLTEWWQETMTMAEFAAQLCPSSLLQSASLVARLHFQRDQDERFTERYKAKSWPEYMSLALALRDEVLLDPDSHATEPFFMFMERSVTTSTKAYDPRARARTTPFLPPSWIFRVFWECVLNHLNKRCRRYHSVTGRIFELHMTSDDIRPSPFDWRALLIRLCAIRRFRLSGIKKPDHGLIHIVLSLGIRDGIEIAGPNLREIHLPDWDWDAGSIPVLEIQEILHAERENLTAKVKWF